MENTSFLKIITNLGKRYAFDSLKSLYYILSSSEIRKLTNEEKSKKSRNSETEKIESFFIFQEI